MKKLSLVLSLVLFVLNAPPVYAADYIYISSVSDLLDFAEFVNSGNDCTDMSFVVTQDIDLEGVGWEPVGTEQSPFNGTLFGEYHTIFNLTVEGGDQDNIGMFSYVGPNANIYRLNLEGGYIRGSAYTGSLVGKNQGLLYQCTTTATVHGESYTGGLVGNNEGTISECESSSTVTGNTYTGGLTGYNNGVISLSVSKASIVGDSFTGGITGENTKDIYNSENQGSIYATGDNIGGVAGINNNQFCIISHCVNKGDMMIENAEAQNIGGIVGYNHYMSEIQYSFNEGDITSTGSNVGGIVGKNEYFGKIIYCINKGTIKCDSTTAVNYGGIVGSNEVGGTVSGSANHGRIISLNPDDAYVGGIAGVSNMNCAVDSSYNNAPISAAGSVVGGIVGLNNFGSTVQIVYNTAAVSSEGEKVGGLVGVNSERSVIRYSYNLGSVSASSNYGCIVGMVDDQENMLSNISNCVYNSETGSNAIGNMQDDNPEIVDWDMGKTVSQLTDSVNPPSAFGSGWTRRQRNDEFCYYPEIYYVFASGMNAIAELSEQSARVPRRNVAFANLPQSSPIDFGAQLSSSELIPGEVYSVEYGESVSGSVSWEDPEVIPPVDNQGYAVNFQPDNADLYIPQTITVKANVMKIQQQPLTLALSGSVPAFSPNGQFSIAASGGSGDGIITYKILNDDGTVAIYDEKEGQVTMLRQGSVTLIAVKAESDNYLQQVSNELEVIIAKGTQEILQLVPPAQSPVYSPSGQFSVSYSGGSGTGAVSYAITEGQGLYASIDDPSTGIVNILGAGKIKMTVTRQEDENYNETVSDEVVIEILKAQQTGFEVTCEESSIVYQPGAQLTFVATGGQTVGNISYRLLTGKATINNSTGVVTVTGAGDIIVEATREGNSNYLPVRAEKMVTVERAAQQPLFITPIDPVEFENLKRVKLHATGGSGEGELIFTITEERDNSGRNTVIASIDGDELLLRHSGKVWVQALRQSDGGYDAQYSDIIQIEITPAEQSQLTIVAANVYRYSDKTFALKVDGGNGTGDVTYNIISQNPQDTISLEGNIVTILGIGSLVLNATKAGDNDYLEKDSDFHVINILKGERSAPVGITAIAPTNSKNIDGVISGLKEDTLYEYRKVQGDTSEDDELDNESDHYESDYSDSEMDEPLDTESEYIKIPAGSLRIEGLSDGIYHVRIQEDRLFEASADSIVEIEKFVAKPISQVELTDFAAPVTYADADYTYSGSSPDFTVAQIEWTPELLNGKFLSYTVYTATLTLEADDTCVFEEDVEVITEGRVYDKQITTETEGNHLTFKIEFPTTEKSNGLEQLVEARKAILAEDILIPYSESQNQEEWLALTLGVMMRTMTPTNFTDFELTELGQGKYKLELINDIYSDEIVIEVAAAPQSPYEIKRLLLTGVVVPRVGDDSQLNLIPGNPLEMTVSSATWSPDTVDGTFDYDTQYTLTVVAEANEGYCFGTSPIAAVDNGMLMQVTADTDVCTLIISGFDATSVNPGIALLEDDKKALSDTPFSVPYEHQTDNTAKTDWVKYEISKRIDENTSFTLSETIAGSKSYTVRLNNNGVEGQAAIVVEMLPIDNITVSGFVSPSARTVPVGQLTTGNPSHYVFQSIEWRGEMVNDMFYYDTQYYADVILVAAVNYTFANVSPQTDVGVVESWQLSDGGSTLKFTVAFDRTEIDPITKITSAGVSSLVLPRAGVIAPVTLVSDDEEQYGVSSLTWEPIPPGGRFDYDMNYTAYVRLTAKPGYKFIELIPTLLVGVPNDDVVVDPVDMEGNNLSFSISFTKTSSNRGTSHSGGSVTGLLTSELPAKVVMPAFTYSENNNSIVASMSIEDFRQYTSNYTVGFAVNFAQSFMYFDIDATQALSAYPGGAELLEIISSKVDENAFGQEFANAVAGRPVYDFSIRVGGSRVTNLEKGTIKVSVPYMLEHDQRPGALLIRGSEGQRVRSVYNKETESLDFNTNKLGVYGIAYNPVDFYDVLPESWYFEAVDYNASRGYTNGTGYGLFEPDIEISRAQFLVMLMRAYGIEPIDTHENFDDAGNAYYTPYLAAAKKFGISNGNGQGLFEPDKHITRQEVVVLTYRVLELLNALPDASSDNIMNQFIDSYQVAPWAKDAMSSLVSLGVINGIDKKLAPLDNSSRAQLAQILYNLAHL